MNDPSTSTTPEAQKTMVLRFMAAAIAVTEGVDPRTLIESDEQWNRYITHAHMVYDQLEADVLIAHFGGQPQQWHRCDVCKAKFNTRSAKRICEYNHNH